MENIIQNRLTTKIKRNLRKFARLVGNKIKWDSGADSKNFLCVNYNKTGYAQHLSEYLISVSYYNL